jgi:hypothetical protein
MPIQVFVKTIVGVTTVYEVETTLTVSELKKRIEDREGVPVAQLRLVYAGRELEDGQTLGHYGVIDQSNLFMVL